MATNHVQETIFKLKQQLIEKQVCIQNNYLDLYCNLIINNLHTKKVTYKTQKHHIIPRYYYRENNLKVDNSTSNIVNLKFTDHFLAHYYLSLCSKNNSYSYANYCSMRFLLKNIKVSMSTVDLKLFLDNLDQYQIIYENYKKMFGEIMRVNNSGKIVSKHTRNLQSIAKKNRVTDNKTRDKLSCINKGKIYLTKADKTIWINSETSLSEYLKNGWVVGRKDLSATTKAKISFKNKGRHILHKETKEIHVKESDLQSYLNAGWKIGRVPKVVYVYKDSQNKNNYFDTVREAAIYYQKVLGLQKSILYFERLIYSKVAKSNNSLNNFWYTIPYDVYLTRDKNVEQENY